jgi:hypothetical protein
MSREFQRGLVAALTFRDYPKYPETLLCLASMRRRYEGNPTGGLIMQGARVYLNTTYCFRAIVLDGLSSGILANALGGLRTSIPNNCHSRRSPGLSIIAGFASSYLKRPHTSAVSTEKHIGQIYPDTLTCPLICHEVKHLVQK